MAAAAPTEPRVAAPAVTTAVGVGVVLVIVPLLAGVVTTATVLVDELVMTAEDVTVVDDAAVVWEASDDEEEGADEELLLLPVPTLAQNSLVAGRTLSGGVVSHTSPVMRGQAGGRENAY